MMKLVLMDKCLNLFIKLWEPRLSQRPWWKDKRNFVCVLAKGRLSKVQFGAGRASEKLEFLFLGSWLFSLKRLEFWVPRPPCAESLVHCLISFLLTLPLCMMASCWLGPIFLPQIVYKILHFLINLLGVKHSLCKITWP